MTSLNVQALNLAKIGASLRRYNKKRNQNDVSSIQQVRDIEIARKDARAITKSGVALGRLNFGGAYKMVDPEDGHAIAAANGFSSKAVYDQYRRCSETFGEDLIEKFIVTGTITFAMVRLAASRIGANEKKGFPCDKDVAVDILLSAAKQPELHARHAANAFAADKKSRMESAGVAVPEKGKGGNKKRKLPNTTSDKSTRANPVVQSIGAGKSIGDIMADVAAMDASAFEALHAHLSGDIALADGKAVAALETMRTSLKTLINAHKRITRAATVIAAATSETAKTDGD